MKKVIALTLVLAASAFAADLNVAIQGPTELIPGETAQIAVVLLGDSGATEALLNANMLLRIPHHPDGLDLEITSVSMNPVLTDIGVDPVPASMGVADGYLMSFYGPYTPITEDFVAFTFDVTVTGGLGDITISLYDHNDSQPQHNDRETNFNYANGTFNGVTTPLNIYIPEPTSLALLAIGGLAVLRRR